MHKNGHFIKKIPERFFTFFTFIVLCTSIIFIIMCFLGFYSWFFNIYLIAFTAILLIFNHLNKHHLNCLFSIRYKNKDTLAIYLNTAMFVSTAWKNKYKKTSRIKNYYNLKKYFIDTVKKTINFRPNTFPIFIVETWLLTESEINAMKETGFIITKICFPKSFLLKFHLSLIYIVSHLGLNGICAIIKRPFYRITWDKSTAKEFIRTYK